MKRLKLVLAMLLTCLCVGCFAFALTACGSSGGTDTGTNTTDTSGNTTDDKKDDVGKGDANSGTSGTDNTDNAGSTSNAGNTNSTDNNTAYNNTGNVGNDSSNNNTNNDNNVDVGNGSNSNGSASGSEQVTEKHSLTLVGAKSATCTTAGNVAYYTCSHCDKWFSDANATTEISNHTSVTIVALNHDYATTFTVDKEATCTEVGSKSKHCTRCDSKIDVTTIDKIAHTVVTDEAVAATCSKTGLTEGKHCSVCNTVIVTQTKVVKPHTEVKDEAVEATCTKTGLTEGKHCSVCNEILVAQTVITKLPHSYKNKICSVCQQLQPTEGLTYKVDSSERNYYLCDIGTATDTEIVIASEYNNLPVKSICNSAFYNCSSLTSITIPNSVTSIGDYAFYGCSSIENISIPDSVTSIGYSAFSGCTKLTTITLPFIGATKDGTDNTNFGYIFGAGSPSHNSSCVPSNLKTVIITGGASIGDWAFEDCSSLTSITIPNSVTNIGIYVFYGCSNLQYNEYDNTYYLGNDNNPYLVLVKAKTTDITSCTINSNTKIICLGAFDGCSSLESITLPFVGSSLKTSSDTYQSSFGYIFGTSSYTGGVATKQYYYDYSTSSITSSTYYIPSSLKSVTITGGNILYGAFYNCSSLTSVNIKNRQLNKSAAEYNVI